MKNFYEICKVLISTDSFYKEGTPHAMVTSMDYYTQKSAGSVEFDYAKIYNREDEYHDIVGFYHTHPSGMNHMSPIDIETMNQWVRCLGKSLVCVIETDSDINGWAFVKEEGNRVSHREIQVHTGNDVNYDIWFESRGSFWNPTDFLLDAEYFDEEMDEEECVIKELIETVKGMAKTQEQLVVGFKTMSGALQDLIQAMTKDEENEK